MRSISRMCDVASNRISCTVLGFRSAHYNTARPHRRLGLAAPLPRAASAMAASTPGSLSQIRRVADL